MDTKATYLGIHRESKIFNKIAWKDHYYYPYYALVKINPKFSGALSYFNNSLVF